MFDLVTGLRSSVNASRPDALGLTHGDTTLAISFSDTDISSEAHSEQCGHCSHNSSPV